MNQSDHEKTADAIRADQMRKPPSERLTDEQLAERLEGHAANSVAVARVLRGESA